MPADGTVFSLAAWLLWAERGTSNIFKQILEYQGPVICRELHPGTQQLPWSVLGGVG